MRPRISSMVLAAAAAGLSLSGCRDEKSCEPDTAFVTFTYGGSTATADTLAVRACLDGACDDTKPVPHKPGRPTGTLTLTFREYRQGAKLDLTVTPTLNNAPLSEPVQASQPLEDGCTVFTVALGGAGGRGGAGGSGGAGRGGSGGVAGHGGAGGLAGASGRGGAGGAAGAGGSVAGSGGSGGGSGGSVAAGAGGGAAGRGGGAAGTGGGSGMGGVAGRGGTGGPGSGGAGSTGAGGTMVECQQNATQCSGVGDLQTCEANGRWGIGTPCGARRSCTGAVGAAKCTCVADPVCKTAGSTCSGTMMQVSCAQDANGCLYQASSMMCTNGSCSGTSCCTNACIANATQTIGCETQSCQVAASGCTAWTMPVSCSSGLVCERYAGPVCADVNWAQWPVPNSPTDTVAVNPASYTDNGNETVTDNVTQLMWQKGWSTTHPWRDAGPYCTSLAVGGYHDWRLPSVVELFSILDYGRVNPISAAFPGTPIDNHFWSSTPLVGSTSKAWFVGYKNGDTFYSSMTETYYVRCVR